MRPGGGVFILHPGNAFAQPPDSGLLDLADTAGGHAHDFGNFIDVQFFHEIKLQNQRLAFGQLRQRPAQKAAHFFVLHLVFNRLRAVGKQQRVIGINLIQAFDLARAELGFPIFQLAHRDVERRGYFRLGRVAQMFLRQAQRDSAHLLLHGDAGATHAGRRAEIIDDRPANADGGIGGKAGALARHITLRRIHKAHIAHLKHVIDFGHATDAAMDVPCDLAHKIHMRGDQPFRAGAFLFGIAAYRDHLVPFLLQWVVMVQCRRFGPAAGLPGSLAWGVPNRRPNAINRKNLAAAAHPAGPDPAPGA